MDGENDGFEGDRVGAVDLSDGDDDEVIVGLYIGSEVGLMVGSMVGSIVG